MTSNNIIQEIQYEEEVIAFLRYSSENIRRNFHNKMSQRDFSEVSAPPLDGWMGGFVVAMRGRRKPTRTSIIISITYPAGHIHQLGDMWNSSSTLGSVFPQVLRHHHHHHR